MHPGTREHSRIAVTAWRPQWNRRGTPCPRTGIPVSHVRHRRVPGWCPPVPEWCPPVPGWGERSGRERWEAVSAWSGGGAGALAGAWGGVVSVESVRSPLIYSRRPIAAASRPPSLRSCGACSPRKLGCLDAACAAWWGPPLAPRRVGRGREDSSSRLAWLATWRKSSVIERFGALAERLGTRSRRPRCRSYCLLAREERARRPWAAPYMRTTNTEQAA